MLSLLTNHWCLATVSKFPSPYSYHFSYAGYITLASTFPFTYVPSWFTFWKFKELHCYNLAITIHAPTSNFKEPIARQAGPQSHFRVYFLRTLLASGNQTWVGWVSCVVETVVCNLVLPSGGPIPSVAVWPACWWFQRELLLSMFPFVEKETVMPHSNIKSLSAAACTVPCGSRDKGLDPLLPFRSTMEVYLCSELPVGLGKSSVAITSQFNSYPNS